MFGALAFSSFACSWQQLHVPDIKEVNKMQGNSKILLNASANTKNSSQTQSEKIVFSFVQKLLLFVQLGDQKGTLEKVMISKV